ncbi:hypothetical protein BJV78DRAFT_1283292 [Lactifluus subvellereus]|nr:hypothetical protein BJV78DRAFT_1283292 [Lactifluus subvellereus]
MADDALRALICLIEGESSAFIVYPTGSMNIIQLKELVHEKGKNGVLSNVDAKDLTLWKVDLEPPPEDEWKHIAGKDVPGSIKLKMLDNISAHWPATTPPDLQHLHIIVELSSEALPDMQGILQAALKLYGTLWGKDLNDILLDVPHGNGLKYVPKSWMDDLELRAFKYKEDAFLVREEYAFAFDKLETRSADSEKRGGGVVVLGQPGIGKTCFLFYALFRRLCAKKPTAFHASKHFVVFKDTGVTVHDAAEEEYNVLPAETWALTDSNEYNKGPCTTFLCASAWGRAWIVQATSPAGDRWYQWSKEYHAGLFVMQCPTPEELIALCTIFGLDLDRFREQIKLWGHSARTCVTLTRDPLQISSRIDLATRAAQKFVEKPDSFIDESQTRLHTDSHVLLTIRPRDPQRNSVVGDIETSFLRNLVDTAIKELDAAKQVNFFHTISKHPSLGASVGYVFEKFVYAWFFAPPKLEELPCTPRSPGLLRPLHTIPVCKEVMVFSGMSTFESASKHKTPFCWLPTSQVFPVTDAIICTNTHIITIQSTVSSHHDLNVEQFKKIQAAFLKSFQHNRQWCHVFITNEEDKAKALREQVFRGLPNGVDIYSAVLGMDKFRLTAAKDLTDVERVRSEADKKDGGRAGN